MFRPTSDRRRPAPPAPTPTARIEGDRLIVEGPRIADVLAVVHQRLGTDAVLVRTDRSIVGGVAGFFGREHFTIKADASALLDGAPAEPVPAPDGPAVDDPADEHGVVDGTGDELVGDDFAAHLARALRAAEPGGPSDEELVARLQGLLVEDPAPTITGGPGPEEARTGTAPEPDPSTPGSAPVAATPELDARLVLLTLAAPGLDPCELGGRIEALRSAPPVPVERGIVAVVGERDHALAVAGRLCGEDGGSVDDVVVVAPDAPDGHPAWMWVGSPDEAAARRDRWNRRPGRCVVAVLLPPGDDARRWARAALDALDPAEVRLAVPGWRTADEVVARRLHGLAPVDGIDLVGDVDPATAVGFLTSEVPVLSLDGGPATVERWGELLRSVAGPATGSDGPAPGTDAVASAVADPALR